MYEKFYMIMALMVFLLSCNAFLQVSEGIANCLDDDL